MKNNDGIPVEKPGQKPEYGEIPEKIQEIIKKAQSEKVQCQATVTALDKSDESDMSGDETIYFINKNHTDTLSEVVLTEEDN